MRLKREEVMANRFRKKMPDDFYFKENRRQNTNTLQLILTHTQTLSHSHNRIKTVHTKVYLLFIARKWNFRLAWFIRKHMVWHVIRGAKTVNTENHSLRNDDEYNMLHTLCLWRKIWDAPHPKKKKKIVDKIGFVQCIKMCVANNFKPLPQTIHIGIHSHMLRVSHSFNTDSSSWSQ